MKVTAIKTFICHCYRTNWVFCKVETDAGIHGWGEATPSNTGRRPSLRRSTSWSVGLSGAILIRSKHFATTVTAMPIGAADRC